MAWGVVNLGMRVARSGRQGTVGGTFCLGARGQGEAPTSAPLRAGVKTGYAGASGDWGIRFSCWLRIRRRT